MDRGQEGGREAASWSYSSGLQDQVSDLLDRGEEGGGQHPVGITVLDFRIRSVTSWTEDRKEEINIYLTNLDFRIRSVTSWTEDRKEEDTQPFGLLTGLQDQVSDLLDGRYGRQVRKGL